ncbi:ABC-type nitrate/sulfonate/bicarbonate transport system substrate-binding protein [Variovorax boronicumulans]|uniref:ABC-type nitrate/sulfonate/bicarbonate transport system substrate-binding protein n=1 Tax=Variovorax boronicumulans TaxID=436515 RepID=A0AAW8D155_9BURK|nr:ABC transporter substrate-binding protein [Variovorax boronicumulans]MDP9894915.1 ABC-type nitrate/sulfonate/bicarbonate transport system substrate-binding protein [Variovorax boronicumulans]MDQ0054765.1 ABC-type nitrate/sulfonate/bicarbonate transport system substrate-binding protein [Variovorax boronicumulans]
MLNKYLRDAAIGLVMAAAALAATAQPAKAKLVLPAVSILFAPVYIAQDAGYFKDAGVDVEISQLAGPAALNALIGGSSDFTTIAGLIQLRAAQRGQKTLAIAGLQENATTEIVLSAATAERLASAKTPMDRARALKGLTLAVDAANGLPHAYLRFVARQASIDADRDIRLVFIAPPGMDAALQKKEVDGFVFSSPFTLEAVRRGAHLWISGPRGDFPEVNPTTYNVLVARDGFCRSATATCRHMVGALDRSLALIAAEPQKALALLSKRFEKMDPELLKQAFESFQRNTPARSMPMGTAFQHTVDVMFGPQDDKAALKALAKSLYTDDFVGSGK